MANVVWESLVVVVVPVDVVVFDVAGVEAGWEYGGGFFGQCAESGCRATAGCDAK